MNLKQNITITTKLIENKTLYKSKNSFKKFKFALLFKLLKMNVKPHKTNLSGAYRCLFSCLMFYA